MEEGRGLVGLEARTADGGEVGRITEVLADEETGEVTHVVVELAEGEWLEVPITSLVLDADADFATFEADRSDVEPGDHVGDVGDVEGSESDDTTGDSDEDVREHEGQLVTEPESPEEGQSEEELQSREDWEDESYTADSGYPRNDVYVNPETGEEETEPLIRENETLGDNVEDLLVDTDLSVRSAEDGVVELVGAVDSQDDLQETIAEIMGLDDVREVDTTDVDVVG